MKPILVTGGAGYIGSHTCKTLAERDFLPVTFDNLSTGHEWAVKWGPLEIGDLCDPDRLDAVLEKYSPEAIIHFAGLINVGESVHEPERYFAANVTGSLNLIEAASRHDIQRFVFSSSCAVYGEPVYLPMDETHPLAPINPYGENKLEVETALIRAEEMRGTRWLALRYFNAAGADPAGEIGEAHTEESHLIPLALAALLRRSAPLYVYGDDYDTEDGTCLRDYIHVSDLAEAHVSGLDYLFSGGESRALNLGTGQGHSVREILGAIAKVTGENVPHEIMGRRAGDAPALIADPALAKTVLEWTPQFPEIETIIQDAWNWHRKMEAR